MDKTNVDPDQQTTWIQFIWILLVFENGISFGECYVCSAFIMVSLFKSKPHTVT